MGKNDAVKHTYICETEYHLLLALLFAIARYKKYGYRSLIIACNRISYTTCQNITRYFAFIDCIAIEREHPDFTAMCKRYSGHHFFRLSKIKIMSQLSSEYPDLVEYLKRNIGSSTVLLFKPEKIFLRYTTGDHTTSDTPHTVVEVLEDGLATYQNISPYYKYWYIYRYFSFPKNILVVYVAFILNFKIGFKVFSRIRMYIPQRIRTKLEWLCYYLWWSSEIQKIYLRKNHVRSVYHTIKNKTIDYDFRHSMESIDRRYKEKLLSVFLDHANEVRLRATLTNASGLLITQDFASAKPSSVIQVFQKILQRYFSARDKILIKPHPDKRIDWGRVFAARTNVVLLEAHFPLELINYYPNTIQKAVAVKSTALYNLYTIPHRIEVWSERYGPVENKDIKKLSKYLGKI